MMICPTCGDEFDSDRSMKIHHKLSHEESIALKESECVNCGSDIKYYPSNKEGFICEDCGKSSDDWAEAMDKVPGFDRSECPSDKGKNGPSYQRKKVKQIKESCSCNRCNYSENARALQFHHLGDKFKGIPKMVEHSHTWEELLNELDKCEIVCANCHVIEHTDW